ncbi:hypothetical protein SLEP1_g55437 [Rubroshorea leprosula]|uniref:SWIM-type domain-containing protein n=1 Tax=Rubroshorea leprosula TaxID=152421 RepID=A0AAV5MHX0_9ROSI|nr:hypothetical protein SLEP1_g55437 [Rubroshorea leprosula]
MSVEIIDIDLEGDSDGSGNEVRFLSTNLLLRCVKVMLNGWGCLVIVLVSDECSKKVGKVGFSNICLLTCFLKRGIWSPPYVFFMGQCVYLYGSNKVSIARYDPDMVEHIWYLEPGKTLSDGLKQVIGDASIREILDILRVHNKVHIYVIHILDFPFVVEQFLALPAPGDEANKGQETDNGSKRVETEGVTHGKGVDGEVRVEESQKESVVEDYYEPGQDFTAKGVWLEKEDEAGVGVEKEDKASVGVQKEAGAGVEKERAGASQSEEVADDHNDDLDGDKEAEGDEGHYDPVMDIPKLTDNEDEEAMEARKKVKSFCYNFQEDNAGPSSYHDGGVNAAGPSTPLAAVHDDGDEMQSDAEYSYISTDEDDGSDADHASRRRATHAVYEEVEDALPDIRLGMIFVSKAHFKVVVDRCNAMQRRDIKWKKNDSKWIRAVCKHAPSCDWKILLSKDAVTDSWMVKTYIHEHTCGEELTSKRFNSTSASKYLVRKMGFASLYLKADDIFQTIWRNIGLELTGKQCKKAREKIARVFEGNCLMEYSKLWDYAAELRRRDSAATILIQAPRPTTNANPIFMRMYVCFSAMKLGFVAGCRPVIGVDGAFLKGAYKGVLLVAVGRDANDQMYPLAWAVVEDAVTDSWMVKTYIHEHTCGEELTSKRFNSTSASKYLVRKMGFASLYLKADDIFQTIRRNTRLELIGKQCKKAREKIARVFEGNCLMEYSKLWDYAAELRRRDPAATILIQAPRPTTNANPIFMRMYVCFSAMKLGFVAGCRRVIRVDGAFLKGAYKGVLLVAVGRDANDQMYPLAWAVVEVEKTETWRWFLEELQSDMQIGSGNRFTIISDQQKGLINAIKELFPDAEHRRCARHVYANFRKDNRGKELQRAFWKCAKATTEADFIKALGELTNIKQRARAAVLKVHPQFWSKAFFKEDNLRMMCGRRTVARRTFADEKFVGDFGPKIWEKIVASREGSKRCKVLWPGGAGYEVEEEDKGKFIVDMNRKTCTCRCWNMTSIPCKHAEAGNNEAFEATEATENLNDNNPVSQANDPASQVVNEERRPVQERRTGEKRKREKKSGSQRPTVQEKSSQTVKRKKRQKKGSTSSATRPRKGGQSGARG